MRTKGTPNLLCDEQAATACIIAFQTLGLNLETIFNTINDALN
jgi:hypothetical protein